MTLKQVSSIFSALFFMTTPIIKHANGTFFGLLALLSLRELKKPLEGWQGLSSEQKLIAYTFVGVFVSGVLSFIFSDYRSRGFSALDRDITYLLFIPLLFMFNKTQINIDNLWIAIGLGGLFSGLGALLEYGSHSFNAEYRTVGATISIVFGHLVTAFSVLSYIGIFYFLQEKKKWPTILMVAGSVFGLIAAILSGTRGAWIIFPLLVLLSLYIFSRVTEFRLIKIVSIMVVIFALLLVVFADKLDVRINRTIEQVEKYQDPNSRMTGLSGRLEMWASAIQMYKENPVFGVGPGDYHHQARIYVRNKLFHHYINKKTYKHPHSDFFWFISERGTVGMVSFFALFLLPLYLFWKKMYQTDCREKYISIGVVFFILSVLLSGIAEAVLASYPVMYTYIITIALFSSFVFRKNLKESLE